MLWEKIENVKTVILNSSMSDYEQELVLTIVNDFTELIKLQLKTANEAKVTENMSESLKTCIFESFALIASKNIYETEWFVLKIFKKYNIIISSQLKKDNKNARITQASYY